MSTIEVPKTYKAQIDEMEIGDSFPINKEKRDSYANVISAFHRDTNRRYRIVTDRDTLETKVWRLEDVK